MAIQYEELPFYLELTQNYSTHSTKTDIKFERSANYILSEEDFLPIQLKELQPISVTFSCNNPNAKFFMSGFESLNSCAGFSSLDPSTSPREVFTHENFPLVPGFYYMTVTLEQIVYYSSFEIIPLHIKKQEWQIMKEEVSKDLSTLTQDFVKRYTKSLHGSSGNNSKENNLLYRFRIIDQHFSRVLPVLNDFSTKVNYQVKKEYVQKYVGKPSIHDTRSIMLNSRYSKNLSKEIVPNITRNYDLPENRYAKKVIKELKRVLNNFLFSLQSAESDISNRIVELQRYNFNQKNSNEILNQKKLLEQIMQYRGRATKIRAAIHIIENSDWYQQVSDTLEQKNIPIAALLDPRYKIIFQLSKELKTEPFGFTFDIGYSYQWKRTDKLYELWGILRIIRILTEQELAFTPCEGWLYDASFDKINPVFVPVLKSGTSILLKKDDISIRISYDKEVPTPYNVKDTLDEPLHTVNNNNKPDCRIDVYYQSIYVGSLVIDFKYRRPEKIFCPNEDKALKQLHAYSVGLSSDVLYSNNVNPIIKNRIQPVSDVFAFTPVEPKTKIITFSPSINLMLLAPSVSTENIKALLLEKIMSLIETYKELQKVNII